MRKEYKTPKELSNLIEEALFDYTHTPDAKARDKYFQIIKESAIEYHELTGEYYRR